MIWDVTTGGVVQELQTTHAQPHLAFESFLSPGSEPYLAGLVEGQLRLYRWS